jgi:uncharacterized membrane protein
MVLGPFTVIYGIGALILYIGLSKIDGKKLPRVFLFGALAGTAVEFFASFFQEAVVGSVSWDYSSKPLNIGGRVCLLYSVYWGLLAILWCKAIQPLFVKMIARIPKRFYRPLTIGLAVFLAVNIVISLAAVYRWGTRMDGVPPSGLITTVLDSLFPDDFMQAVYSNMLW